MLSFGGHGRLSNAKFNFSDSIDEFLIRFLNLTRRETHKVKNSLLKKSSVMAFPWRHDFCEFVKPIVEEVNILGLYNINYILCLTVVGAVFEE